MIKKKFLSLKEQKRIVDEVKDLKPGLYSPVLRSGSKMSIKMNCLGYDWSAKTYKYDPVREDGKTAAVIPDYLQSLAHLALLETHYWPESDIKPFDICIVNWYTESSKLGLHKDDSETEASLETGYPVVCRLAPLHFL